MHHTTQSLDTEKKMAAAESAGGFAVLKAFGVKTICGMIGAGMLYVVLPPIDKTGRFDRKEFVCRLAIAGLFSNFFGDMAIEALSGIHHLQGWIDFHAHASAVYLMTGAPGWWISRAVALWFQRRNGKDIAELVKDVKESV